MEGKSVFNKYKLQSHPQENSNFLSDLFFCWTIPMFKTGFKKELTEEDIYKPLKRHDASRLVGKLEKAWNEQLDQSVKPSLWKAIWKIFKWDTIISMSLYFFIEFIIKISRPVALGKLMGYYSPTETEVSKTDAIIYASIIVIASFIDAVVGHAWIIQFQQLSMKVRVAVSSLLYRKALRLSKKALNETTVGHIINLLSNDMHQLVLFFGAFNALWASPLQAVLILYILYYISGPTALAGLVFIVTLTPLQLLLSKKAAFYRLRIALKTDERIRYMSEIISGIQVIKVYNWEQPFVKLIDAIRRKEMYLIKIANYLNALTTSFSFFIDRTAIFLCIVTYVLTGSSPNAQYVFVLASFYDMLMISVSLYLPDAVSDILQSNVAIKRFENFLNLEEVGANTIISNEIGLTIQKATAKWSKDSTQNTLNNINLKVEGDQVVAIIGPIGSGKSSLLQLCLNELSISEGFVQTGGRISYANQEPWLFAGTVKQNILFGTPMDKHKYKEVIKVCALEEDLGQFPHGDNTIVGERGILLSGGQKARINLARAVYRDADIYLLDDPLSAVDASVGKHIFNHCIKDYLKGKCVILVTHQIQYLSSVDKMYLVVNGAIAVSGNYQELQASGEDFAKVLNNTENFDHEEVLVANGTTDTKEGVEQDEEEENRTSGKVSKEVYMSYIRASGSYCIFLVMILLFVLTEIFATGSDYFITFWVNLEQRRLGDNISLNSSDFYFEDVYFTKENCIYLYTGIIGLLIIFATVRSMSFIRGCMVASVHLHDKMFTSIVKATMRFFYTNSSGRILNRFSKDIGAIDEDLPDLLMDVLQLTLSVIGTVGAICIVSPWTLIPTLAISIIMYFIRMIFLTTSRSIKRMESTNRSPIFAHLTESMKGLTTIRAYNAELLLEKEFDNYQNVHSSVFYMYLGSNRAFATWLDSVCVIYVLLITVIALTKETYGGNVGFVITQGMSLTGMFQWGMRRWSELENQMTSVERVIEYIDVKRESDNQTTKPKLEWLQHGKIEFRSVSMKYSPDDPYVLKNLNVVIKPNEKVGIVGRTGAGKSSLISVLFRLVDFEGNIFIDDVDTKSVSLSSVRSGISIIPQEPILFSGSVRKNLDPFDEYGDEKIWNVLEEVKLKDFIIDLPAGLYSNLSEGGSNFSVGQKQLICLARALLRNNKILMLDEATANVDPHTDELLQKTIRTNFANCTVLTIAHRLHTIMDSDKVLVMDNGRAVEFDHPYILLQKKGAFYDLVMETGRKMGDSLIEVAEKNYSSYNYLK
ncbi:probable multidrug resistance-associated protein lethal(2)03659 [Zophobas morio]|uniref:probable multidrug resistance-associated protein lethal(2)03659 n=1 Tax=Zophobas morio TaxID=2755281 RepID=UPI003083963C